MNTTNDSGEDTAVPSPSTTSEDANSSPDKADNTNKMQSDGINVLLFKRLCFVCPLLFPGACSPPVILFVLLLLTCILEQYVVYYVGLISSQYYLVLGQYDWDGFVSTTLNSTGLVIAIAGILSAKSYIGSILYISWRQALSTALHRLYFSGINYYSITAAAYAHIDNPDQRMTQDVDLFCRTLGTMTVALIIAPAKIGYYTYQAYAGTGWLGPTMILVFFVMSTVVNRFVMNPIVPYVVLTEKCEGDLRFKHMQIRAGSESVAFHVSGSVEATKTNYALHRLVQAKQRLFNRQLWLNLCQNLFDYLGSILSYLAIAVPIFSGVYDDVDSTTLSSIISKNSFVCIMLISSLSSVVDLFSSVVQVAGVTHRIAALLETLQLVHYNWHSINDKAKASYSDLTRAWGNDESPPPYSSAVVVSRSPPHCDETEQLVPEECRVLTDDMHHEDVERTGLPPYVLRTADAAPASASCRDSPDTTASTSVSNSPRDCTPPTCYEASEMPQLTGSAFPVGFVLQDVTIRVPASGNVLVKDLNLCINRGVNLLIMGPSSCGKTSLLRALRGLWPIQKGVLAHQSFTGPKAVMFLPQKPFLTNGTLREQIVYPELLTADCGHDNSGARRSTQEEVSATRAGDVEAAADENVATENVSEACKLGIRADGIPQQSTTECDVTGNTGADSDDAFLEAPPPSLTGDDLISYWMDKMHMMPLLERCGGLDKDPGWIWSDVLSPGEVQRLCFLRVLYHRPHFAILDEATSALSTDIEAVLYTLARHTGVTVISVGHRHTLLRFHHQLLRLDGEGGWTVTSLP